MKLTSGAQVLDVPSGWHFTKHQHAGIEVVGVIQGQVALSASNRHWQASKGQMLAIPPYLSCNWFSTDGASLGVLHILRFPPDLIAHLLPGAQPRLLSVTVSQFAEYERLLSRLVAIADHASPQQIRLLRVYLEAFILALLEEELEQDTTRVPMYEIASYMQAHLDQSLTIAEVARQFSLSEVTLRRRFREAFGMPPKQYLLELRLSEAQQLLATTKLPMQDIALRMGFFDLAHFSSTFRKHIGLSPSAWRMQSQG
jgi:AraC-like DNA-binding protein